MGLFELHWWNVTAGAVQASVVVPIGPSSGGDLDVGDGAVWAVVEDGGANAFGLVEAVDRLHQGVGVADGPDRGQDLLKSKVIGQPNRRILVPSARSEKTSAIGRETRTVCCACAMSGSSRTANHPDGKGTTTGPNAATG